MTCEFSNYSYDRYYPKIVCYYFFFKFPYFFRGLLSDTAVKMIGIMNCSFDAAVKAKYEKFLKVPAF